MGQSGTAIAKISKSVIEIVAPIGGTRYDFPSDLITHLYVPMSQNVHISEGVLKSRFGTVDYAGDNLKLFLYYDANDDGQSGLRTGASTNIKLAQSVLTGGADRTCNKVSLKLVGVGSVTGNLSVTIESDSTGDPDDTPITNGTSDNVDASTITTDAGGEWVDFEFSTAFTLSSDTTYWIVPQGS